MESVSYTVRGPRQHELQPPPGGPRTLSLHFANPQEAQRWAALVRDATMAGQNGSDSLPPALVPETRPVSPPSPLEVPTPKAPQPKVDRPWSPGDLMEKGELAGRLTRAVEGGDEKGAAQAAAILAQHRVALRVQPQEACFPPGPRRPAFLPAPSGSRSQLKTLRPLPTSHCRFTPTDHQGPPGAGVLRARLPTGRAALGHREVPVCP